MKRLTSIEGIFFSYKEPDKVKAWDKKHLGFYTMVTV